MAVVYRLPVKWQGVGVLWPRSMSLGAAASFCYAVYGCGGLVLLGICSSGPWRDRGSLLRLRIPS